MMKNRAVWLVLIVLAIATMLMVFFVMPRLSQEAAAPATPGAETAAAPASGVADKGSRSLAEGAAEKMDRLKAEAQTALDTMESLFAGGRTPGVEAFSAARALAQGAVASLAQIDMPVGLDETLAAAMTKLREDAARTLAMIEALPADPAQAAGMIAGLKQALLGNTVTAQAPVEASSDSITPRFDILRVEPDGSTVIAGNAAPGSQVEIVNGEAVIASLTVDGSGDFAAVLDNPLAAGDYQLQLRATGQDGKTVTSEEVATVSVPEGGKGELLAMVSKPGEASRLITLPTAPAETTVTAVPSATDSAAGSAPLTPDLPAEAQTLAGSAPVIATELAAAPADANLPAEAETQAAAPLAVGTPDIQVSAVEIEGDRIFVAGKAPVGATVRGYANDTLIGDDTVDTSGNFVVSGTVVLPVGSHIIKVELLDASGKVLLRASVPFERPEGEQVSVVAQNAPIVDTDGTSAEQFEFERMRIALAKAVAILQGLYTNGATPSMEQMVAARSSVEIGLQSLANFRVPSTAPDQFLLMVATSATNAKAALSLLQSVPAGDVQAMGNVLPQLIATLGDLLRPPSPPAPLSPTAADQTAGTQATDTAAASDTPADEPQTIEQAPLAPSDNSIIIRRGDTLWQISRRVYGQGVRYTTIYLANANQINNPDRIEPGQIFMVPPDALPDAEEIHRRRLQGEPVN